MMYIKAGCFAVTDAVSGLCVADWEIKLLPNDKEMALSYVYTGKKTMKVEKGLWSEEYMEEYTVGQEMREKQGRKIYKTNFVKKYHSNT